MLFFVLGRSKPKQPAKLNLKSDTKDAEPLTLNDKAENTRIVEAKDVTPVEVSGVLPGPSKRLMGKAVFFVYNGHEWEAHEILGLPRGCTLQMATSHYQNLIRTSDPSTFDFFNAAFSAILKARNN